MTILPISYLGNTNYFARLLLTESVIDLHENWVKQSCRNRSVIMTANGLTDLVVNICSPGNYPKTPVKEIRIDYSKRWQHQHWQSLVSSYRRSPFFEHYADDFEPLFLKNHLWLYDLNHEMLSTVLRLLGSRMIPKYSERYIAREQLDPDDYDMRSALSAKPRLARPDELFHPVPYWQVFSDRMPFAANLSIVDLLFCCGPESLDLLKKSFG